MSIEIETLKNGECRLSLSDITKHDSLDNLFSSLDRCKVLCVVLEEVTSLGWSGLYFYAKLKTVAEEKGIRVKLIR